MLSTRMFYTDYILETILTTNSGCEPLTPDDIAEVVVFAAGRRENVIIADTLVFPNHQVCHGIPIHFHSSS